MSFKLPRPKPKLPERDVFDGLTQFKWEEFKELKEVGQGSYGVVKLGRYAPRDAPSHEEVVVKVPRNIRGNEREFVKEAKLLSSVNGHPNIVLFKAISTRPFGLMTEYVKFSFRPFEDDTVVSSLSEFLSHVDLQYGFEGFEHAIPLIAKEVAVGLKFLHENGIVHRDLKPANILLSNDHYIHTRGDEFEFMWENSPVVCKLADFGEGRSNIIQTQSLLTSRVQELDRGTPAYMSPEVFLPELRPQEATLEQLKAVDSWAFGMILFVLANPSVGYPYQEELQQEASLNLVKDPRENMREILRRRQRPNCSKSYEVQHATVWNDILVLHEEFTDFDINRRKRSMEDALAKLKTNSPSLCVNINLPVSQATAIEAQDLEIAKVMSIGNPCLVSHMEVPNDATNACVFLALQTCDAIIGDCSYDNNSLDARLDDIPQIATQVITNYPTELNRIREISSLYTVLDANKLMKGHNHLQNDFEFTEELPHAEGVFAEVSRNRLQEKVQELAAGETFFSIYTCEPFAFLIGSLSGKMFILDTHPVPENCGGDGNGQLKVFESTSPECCRALCRWLWHRLAVSGVDKSAGQSLAVIIRGSAHFGQNENEESSADISRAGSEYHSEEGDKPADDSGSHSEEARRRSSVNFPVADSGRHSEDARGRSSINIHVDESGRHSEEARARSSVNVPTADSGRHGEVAGGRSGLNFSAAGSKRLKEETLVKSPTTKKRRSRSPEVVVLGDTDDWPEMVHDACGTTRDNCVVVSEDDVQILSTSLDNSLQGRSQIPGEDDFAPSQKIYEDDEALPIFQAGKKERYTLREAVNILKGRLGSAKCSKTPLRVRENLSFLINLSTYKNWEDIKSDMNGAYSHVLRIGTWTLDVDDDGTVEILEKKKVPLKKESEVHIHINSKKSKFGLCRSIFFLSGRSGGILNDTCLLQYHIDGKNCEKLQFEVESHGNRKHGKKPFYPTNKSTMEVMKEELSNSAPAVAFKKVASASGGALTARNPGELPRSRQQMYDLKYKLRKTDEIEELLVYSKQKEEPIIIEHHDVPEDLWIIGKKHMCQDLSRFCTSDTLSHPFSVDPTFNFGRFEVTPFSYKHLLLKSKRTNDCPVFLGPTAIHYSKSKGAFTKIARAVVSSCPNLGAKGKGFITDGEKALHDALSDSMKKVTGLRCFNHFRRNCKDKLNALGIRKKEEQKFFLDIVFGSDEKAILESKDKNNLEASLKAAQPLLDEEEKRLTSTSSPQFWVYLSKNEKMMRRCMIATAREKAGMPSDKSGKVLRCYTNQSETVNNKLTRQKEAISGKAKSKNELTKLEFVRDVWEEVDNQQQLQSKLAICGMSDEYELAHVAAHLEVNPDEWFSWPEEKRREYARKFNELSIEDVNKKKPIVLSNQFTEETTGKEWREFSVEIQSLFSLQGLSKPLVETIVKEAEKLLNYPESIQKMPSLSSADSPRKYLVAAKDCKRQMYECTVHREHVTCTCPCYKYHGLCKHSLCVAEMVSLLKEHIEFLKKSTRFKRPIKSNLVQPQKEATGKKGSSHNNPWRQSRGNKESSTSLDLSSNHPYSAIHHNDRPLVVRFLSQEPRATECRQCKKEFPRRKLQLVKCLPFDIVLAHEEKWMYPDPQNRGAKLPSAKYTTKFYCIKRSCVLNRFPYFDSSYLEISADVKSRLKDAHRKLIQEELHCGEE